MWIAQMLMGILKTSYLVIAVSPEVQPSHAIPFTSLRLDQDSDTVAWLRLKRCLSLLEAQIFSSLI